MIPTLSGYIESLVNSNGRFRTLERIFPRLNDQGKISFTVSSRVVEFDVEWLGKNYVLKCFTRDLEAIGRRADKLDVSVSPDQKEYVADCKYLRGEMLVFDEMNNSHWCDVVLQSVPAGERLDLFIKKCCARRDRQSLEWLLGAVGRMSEWLYRNRYVHGDLIPRNIYVTGDLDLQLINYQMALLVGSRDCGADVWSEDADSIGISLLCIKLYVLACRPELYPHIGRLTCSPIHNNRRILDELWLLAKDNDVVALMNLISMVIGANDRIRDRDKLNSNISALLNLRVNESFRIDSVREFVSCQAVEVEVDLSRMEWVGDVSEGLVRVVDGGDKRWRYVTVEGLSAFPGAYEYAEDFSAGRAVVISEEGYGLIDRSGKYIIDPNCESIVWYGDADVAVVEADGKHKLLDGSGRRVSRKDFDWVGVLDEGLLPARRGEKYGFINTRGEVLVEFIYEDAYSFVDGRALVSLAGEEFYIDSSGVRVE